MTPPISHRGLRRYRYLVGAVITAPYAEFLSVFD